MNRRDWTTAIRILTDAARNDSHVADYHAELAWCLYNQYPGKTAPFGQMLSCVNLALRRNKDHDRAHYYMGMILKRMGDPQSANKYFRRAVQLNPALVDAARELHLASRPRRTLISRIFRR